MLFRRANKLNFSIRTLAVLVCIALLTHLTTVIASCESDMTGSVSFPVPPAAPLKFNLKPLFPDGDLARPVLFVQRPGVNQSSDNLVPMTLESNEFTLTDEIAKNTNIDALLSKTFGAQYLKQNYVLVSHLENLAISPDKISTGKKRIYGIVPKIKLELYNYRETIRYNQLYPYFGYVTVDPEDALINQTVQSIVDKISAKIDSIKGDFSEANIKRIFDTSDFYFELLNSSGTERQAQVAEVALLRDIDREINNVFSVQIPNEEQNFAHYISGSTIDQHTLTQAIEKKVGVCGHKAILFNLIAERMGIGSEMMTGSLYRRGGTNVGDHVINIAHMPSGRSYYNDVTYRIAPFTEDGLNAPLAIDLSDGGWFDTFRFREIMGRDPERQKNLNRQLKEKTGSSLSMMSFVEISEELFNQLRSQITPH